MHLAQCLTMSLCTSSKYRQKFHTKSALSPVHHCRHTHTGRDVLTRLSERHTGNVQYSHSTQATAALYKSSAAQWNITESWLWQLRGTVQQIRVNWLINVTSTVPSLCTQLQQQHTHTSTDKHVQLLVKCEALAHSAELCTDDEHDHDGDVWSVKHWHTVLNCV